MILRLGSKVFFSYQKVFEMKRTEEYFQKYKLRHNKVVSMQPRELFPQETDWTCVVACIRTLLSGITDHVPAEQEFVAACNMKPGPHYSKEIKDSRILDQYDVVYGCDIEQKDFDMILDYMEQGYYIMLESMYNYAHWMVMLGYYPVEGSDIEKSKLLMFDPYYDQVRLIHVDEFISMWMDGDFANNGIMRDFIGIR